MSDFPLYGQLNFFGVPLGLRQAAKDSTIPHYGCRLCCFAMLFGIAPDQLQQAFCVNDGPGGKSVFIASGTFNYIDDTLACELFSHQFKNDPAGRVDCISTAAPLDKLDALLEVNGFVMAYVNATKNMHPAPDNRFREHWILITGKTADGNYLISDPYMNDKDKTIAPRYGQTAAEAVCGWVKIDRVQPAPSAWVDPLEPTIAGGSIGEANKVDRIGKDGTA